jgi:hypothetical protein
LGAECGRMEVGIKDNFDERKRIYQGGQYAVTGITDSPQGVRTSSAQKRYGT